MRRSASPSSRALAGELLATAVTLATLAGGVRLFDGTSFVAPVLGAALLAHLLVALMRRAGRGVALSALVSLVSVAGLQVWVHYPRTTTYGVPRRATFEAMGADLGGIWELLRSSRVPLSEDTGLLVVAAAVAWLLALLSDWAAFRVGARGEALAPAAILLALVATFGTTDGTILYPTVSVACAVAFALAHATARSGARPVVGAAPKRRVRLPRGLVAGALAVGAGALVTTALLPSLDDGPLRKLLDPSAPATDGGRKVVLSPLVAVPGQLLQNPDLELFVVRSTGRSYWRLTALGDFDGAVWSLDESTGAAGESLPTLAATSGPVSEFTQSYRIGALAAVWLPAAYQPVAFEPLGTPFEASFEPISSTLLVGSGRADSDGLSYTVQSAVPRFEGAFLGSLRNDPEDVPAGFVDLPADLNASLAELALQVTAGRDGPYEQALALQDWLRDGFDYDLDVAPGHSSDRLEAFLFSERRGYCEQFAGAFATLARTLGLPTRVAVGFTPGVALETDATGRTLYSVRGQHAHAWPEVYISGAGWVAFEPTPGRGAPGAESYTLVPEQQDSPLESPAPAVPDPPGPGPDADSPAPAPPAPPSGGEFATEGGGTGAARILALAGLALAAAAGAAGLYAAATAGLRSLQRRRRRRWAGADAGRGAIVAWEEILDLLRPRRIRPHLSETPLEMAQRASRLLGSAPEPWRRLAFCVSVAAFAGGPMPAELQRQVATASSSISADLRETRTAAQRLRGVVDPRPWGVLVRVVGRGGAAR
ncbi:MAG: transglutaminase domain-containing protein [Acidimicrobiia bacterium]|nr:transglutaminase domain-containing protein [Acidimicrobiia bacterium]MYC44409.1 transglutaminase domain-containing protein [Acidimicrobiia bacterium]